MHVIEAPAKPEEQDPLERCLQRLNGQCLEALNNAFDVEFMLSITSEHIKYISLKPYLAITFKRDDKVYLCSSQHKRLPSTADALFTDCEFHFTKRIQFNVLSQVASRAETYFHLTSKK